MVYHRYDKSQDGYLYNIHNSKNYSRYTFHTSRAAESTGTRLDKDCNSSSGYCGSTETVWSETAQILQHNRTEYCSNAGHRSSANEYEELFKDSVPCPTCRGLGRVSKEQEGQLVALIPMKDKRLKPRRTSLYVGIAVALCVLVAGLSMFFLFPRDIAVTSNNPLLSPISLDLNVSASFVNMTVMNFYNFSNSNFFTVKITGTQMSSLYDEKVIAVYVNKSTVDIPMRSTLSYGMQMTFILSKTNDWGFLVLFCEDRRSWVHNLPFTFQLTANYTYLGHNEQATLTTLQQVSCYNNTAQT